MLSFQFYQKAIDRVIVSFFHQRTDLNWTGKLEKEIVQIGRKLNWDQAQF